MPGKPRHRRTLDDGLRSRHPGNICWSKKNDNNRVIDIIVLVGTIELDTPEEVCRLLGARCRTLRLARNLSQTDLAAMTASSLSSIRRLESQGQGTLLLLARVAQALQVARQFEFFLVLPTTRIADVERLETLVARRRAGRAHPPGSRA